MTDPDILPLEIDALYGRALVLLTALGATADEIADSCRVLRLRGERVTTAGCLLAGYLADRLGGDWRVSVGVAWLVGREGFPLPAAAEEFRSRFDDRAYPDLIKQAVTR